MLTENDIRRIVERVVSGYGPLVVGTFGSYAVGTARPSSDLDLFVVKATREPAGARRRAVARLLFGVMHPLDLHVFTPEQFQETVDEELSFEWVITRQARIYHWSPEADRLVPSLVARRLAPLIET